MEDLIKALQIFRKYGNPYSPTHCNHDEMLVVIDPDLVSQEDLKALEELSFNPHSDGHFYSYRFGSA